MALQAHPLALLRGGPSGEGAPMQPAALRRPQAPSRSSAPRRGGCPLPRAGAMLTEHHQLGSPGRGARLVGGLALVVPAVAGGDRGQEQRAIIQHRQARPATQGLRGRALPPRDLRLGGPCRVQGVSGMNTCLSPSTPAPSPPHVASPPHKAAWPQSPGLRAPWPLRAPASPAPTTRPGSPPCPAVPVLPSPPTSSGTLSVSRQGPGLCFVPCCSPRGKPGAWHIVGAVEEGEPVGATPPISQVGILGTSVLAPPSSSATTGQRDSQPLLTLVIIHSRTSPAISLAAGRPCRHPPPLGLPRSLRGRPSEGGVGRPFGRAWGQHGAMTGSRRPQRHLSGASLPHSTLLRLLKARGLLLPARQREGPQRPLRTFGRANPAQGSVSSWNLCCFQSEGPTAQGLLPCYGDMCTSICSTTHHTPLSAPSASPAAPPPLPAPAEDQGVGAAAWRGNGLWTLELSSMN